MENYFQNMNCFSCIKLISFLIYLKYWYYSTPYLDLPWLPHHVCQVLRYPNETLVQHNPHHVLYCFPYFVLPHSITLHHKYWIYKTIFQAQPNKFIQLYTDHIILWVQHNAHQILSLQAECFVIFTTLLVHTTTSTISARNPSL